MEEGQGDQEGQEDGQGDDEGDEAEHEEEEEEEDKEEEEEEEEDEDEEEEEEEQYPPLGEKLIVGADVWVMLGCGVDILRFHIHSDKMAGREWKEWYVGSLHHTWRDVDSELQVQVALELASDQHVLADSCCAPEASGVLFEYSYEYTFACEHDYNYAYEYEYSPSHITTMCDCGHV